jgi:adiponectin receptor
VASAEGENFKRQDSSRDKAYRLWSKVKYQLVKFEALPEHLRDNEYILGHYRVNWPLGPTLLSIFSFHNETLNIWTYGFFFFFFFSLYVNFLFSRLKKQFSAPGEKLSPEETGLSVSLGRVL